MDRRGISRSLLDGEPRALHLPTMPATLSSKAGFRASKMADKRDLAKLNEQPLPSLGTDINERDSINILFEDFWAKLMALLQPTELSKTELMRCTDQAEGKPGKLPRDNLAPLTTTPQTRGPTALRASRVKPQGGQPHQWRVAKRKSQRREKNTHRTNPNRQNPEP
ncbi:Hypothetical predicted protein [Pelobates cultripes]|uniref:Uncharacterized protein n=1 Tax=Pelobates cultripes TaxID=61616 RepID=A0AAD1T2L2_PELCU|nr:Hypothetical predicted protein [Pelobates cultripes]